MEYFEVEKKIVKKSNDEEKEPIKHKRNKIAEKSKLKSHTLFMIVIYTEVFFSYSLSHL